MIRFARSAALAVAMVVLLTPASAAMAQGNSQTHRNDQGGNGPGNNGQGHGQGAGGDEDGGGGSGDGDSNGGGETEGAAGTAPPITPTSNPVSAPGTDSLPASLDSDAERALEAVRSHDALPLEDIVATAAEDHPGKLIDAHLITVGTFLLYELKLLEPDGDVRTFYYYARSGIEVRED